MALLHTLSDADHDRVSAAIRSAEARTSGEIYCVLAGASGRYFFPAAFMLSLAMLAVALVIAWVLDWRWVVPRLPWFVGAQILAYASGLAVLAAFPAVALALVPRRTKYRQAHDHALRQFLARNVHLTSKRTGVLLFVSMAERYAAVVADAGIDAKVEQKTWDAAVAQLVEGARRNAPADGFVAAIATVGAILAAHFPPGRRDRNELDDHLVEI